MALQIPTDFDVHTQDLDDNEKFIRDTLNLQIENWARFRHTINIGLQAGNLHSNSPIAEEVKEAYRELGKSHYEVVISLGAAKLSLEIASRYYDVYDRLFKSLIRNSLLPYKSIKDFYFHAGCLLDNLARLIYIISDSKSATEQIKRKGEMIFLRHWIDWGSLRDYSRYARLKRSKQLREIINIRNNLTHSWSCPIKVEIVDGIATPKWPLAVRKRSDHLWPYEEAMDRRYRDWLPLFPMMESDFEFIESFQNKVFGKLVRDVRKFEQNYGVEIR